MIARRPITIWDEYFSQYLIPIYIALAMFAVGIVFGALAIETLTQADILSLSTYLRHFIHVETSTTPPYAGIFPPALIGNLKILGLFYVLGISVAGMPLVLVVLFFRGFVLGFTGAFLISSLHWQGIALTIIAVVLQNMFIVPALIIVSGVALGFSWQLIAAKGTVGRSSLVQKFGAFTTLVVLMALVIAVGSAVEAYGSPFLIHMAARWGI